jgi:hypothetical protein
MLIKEKRLHFHLRYLLFSRQYKNMFAPDAQSYLLVLPYTPNATTSTTTFEFQLPS